MAAPTYSRGNSEAREVIKQLVTSADLLLHYCSNIQCDKNDNNVFIIIIITIIIIIIIITIITIIIIIIIIITLFTMQK